MIKTMKKKLFLILLVLLTISCSGKDKIEGERIPVFSYKDILQETDKKVKIKIPEKKNNENHYGDSSVLNKRIENYAIDKNLEDKKIKFKKYNISYKPSGKRYKIFAPIVVDNIAYIMSPNGFFYARNLNEPKKNLWKSELVTDKSLKDFSFAKISYSNGKIIISTGYNEIISVDIKDGKIDWVKKLNAVPISYPVVFNKVIYVITNDNKLYALNENNGEIKWIHSGISKNTAILGSANPVIYKNVVLTSYSSGEIYAINRSNGQALWSKTLTTNVYNFTSFELTDIDATPFMKNGNVYAISNAGKLASINIATGNIVWEKDFSSITNFWIADNFLYIINNDNVLSCIEINKGLIQWAQNLPKYKKPKKNKGLIVYKNIVMVNDKLLLVNNLNKMTIVSPIDGKIIKTVKLKHNISDRPIFINGKMYFSATKRLKVRLVEVY